MENVILDILINFGLGLLGVLLTVGIIVREKIAKDSTLDLSKLIKDNIKFWIISLVLLLIIVIGVKVEPAIESIINGFISIENSRGGFFALGIMLAGGIDSSPIGKKLTDKPKDKAIEKS